jgi:hypothetical protein
MVHTLSPHRPATPLAVLLLALAALTANAVPALDTNMPAALELQKAGKLFEAQHWAEARIAYDAARSREKE